MPQFLTGETGAQSISERLSVLAFWVQSGRAAEGLPINRGDRGGGGKSGSLNATACGRGADCTHVVGPPARLALLLLLLLAHRREATDLTYLARSLARSLTLSVRFTYLRRPNERARWAPLRMTVGEMREVMNQFGRRRRR